MKINWKPSGWNELLCSLCDWDADAPANVAKIVNWLGDSPSYSQLRVVAEYICLAVKTTNPAAIVLKTAVLHEIITIDTHQCIEKMEGELELLGACFERLGKLAVRAKMLPDPRAQIVAQKAAAFCASGSALLNCNTNKATTH